MDADFAFKKYLDTWPDAWITWPTKGQAKMRNFFWSDPNDPFEGKAAFDDFLDFVNEECTGNVDLSCSDWLIKYFITVRGRDHAKKYLAKHEPLLAMTSFNIKPLKDLMDGFIKYFIENREALYGSKL